MIALSVGACVFFRIRGFNDIHAYMEMASAFPPVWKDLALRRYSKGDSITDLLIRHPAAYTNQFGSFSSYSFIEGLSFSQIGLAAKDGKLISAQAGSCTWSHTFFESKDALAEMNTEFQRRYTNAQACTNRLVPMLDKETRFDFIRAQPHFGNAGNVRVIGLVGSEADFAELKHIVASANPPFDVEWAVKINADYRTNTWGLRNPPPTLERGTGRIPKRTGPAMASPRG